VTLGKLEGSEKYLCNVLIDESR